MYESALAERQQVLADLRNRLAGLRSGPVGRPLRPEADGRAPTNPALTNPAPDLPPTDVEIPAGRSSGVLAVPDAMAGILPLGGLPRGGVVSLTGDGGVTSLLFGLLAGPDRPWSALVGLPGLGLVAAAELGVDLARVVVIPDPGPDVVQILSILADGVDLIAVAAPAGPLATPARLRVLTARLRQRGAVLLVAGRWPGADLALTTRMGNWAGIGAGYGRLRSRDLEVTVSGRGAAGRNREAVLHLHGSRDGVLLLPEHARPAPAELPSELVADAV